MDRNLLRTELLRDEGLRLTAYRDSLGFSTIGVGHLLGSMLNREHPRMSEITHQEAMALLEADIREAEDTLVEWLGEIFVLSLDEGDPKDQVRYRALVNMCFNLGNKVQQFRNTAAFLQKRDWRTAADNMLLSRWALQVGDRAKRIAHMVETGETA